jgi:hypothetical protein
MLPSSLTPNSQSFAKKSPGSKGSWRDMLSLKLLERILGDLRSLQSFLCLELQLSGTGLVHFLCSNGIAEDALEELQREHVAPAINGITNLNPADAIGSSELSGTGLVHFLCSNGGFEFLLSSL